MKKQSFLKGSAVLMLMVIITKAAGLVYKVKLTSLVGGSGMSCYAGAFAVFSPVFAAAASGAPSAMSRLVSEQLSRGNYKGAVKLRRTAEIMFAILSITLSALLIAFSKPLSIRLIGSEQARFALSAAALSLFPAAMMNVRRGWAEGFGSMNPTAFSEIAETLLKLIFGIAAAGAVMRAFDSQKAASPYAAAAAALGVTAASLSACVYIYFLTRRKSFSHAQTCENDLTRRAAAKGIIKFALPASAAAIISTLASTADLLTIVPGINEAMRKNEQLFSELGNYGIARPERAAFVYGSYTALALTIYGLVPTLTAMLGKSILPELTGYFSNGDRLQAAGSVRSLLLLSAMAAMPCGIGISLLSKPILTLFFASSPAEISVCAAPLSILGTGSVFMGIALPCMSALTACDRQLAAVGITLGSTLLKLLLNRLLIPIPELNICGAALSTAISQLVMFIAAVSLLISKTGQARRAAASLFTPLIPAMLCGACALMVQNSIETRFGRLSALISISFGAIICFVCLCLLCISPKNKILADFSKKNLKNT